jgi:hypothetical protein
MFEIIDTPQDVGKYAQRLAAAGVKSVIRFTISATRPGCRPNA